LGFVQIKTLVKNAFLSSNRWRCLAYAKNDSSFFAAIHIKCLMMRESLVTAASNLTSKNCGQPFSKNQGKGWPQGFFLSDYF
jgi:hypothetical protein